MKYSTKFSTLVLTLCAMLTLATACASNTPAPQPTSLPAPTRAPAQPTSAPVQPSAAGIVTATPAPNEFVQGAPLTKINLNTATSEQILTIPNINTRLASALEQSRPYTTILQFRAEIGKSVDAATVAAYEKYVYVPINVNQSDAATLQQLPNVTPEIAAQLIAARPYGTNQNFLAKLITLVSPADVTAAENYLAP